MAAYHFTDIWHMLYIHGEISARVMGANGLFETDVITGAEAVDDHRVLITDVTDDKYYFTVNDFGAAAYFDRFYRDAGVDLHVTAAVNDLLKIPDARERCEALAAHIRSEIKLRKI